MLLDEAFQKKVIAGENAIHAIFPVLAQSILSRIPQLPVTAIILDIGGSSGLWLESFRAAGYMRGILVEPRHDYASFAADRWQRFPVSHKTTTGPIPTMGGMPPKSHGWRKSSGAMGLRLENKAKNHVPATDGQYPALGYFPVLAMAEALPFPPGTVQLVISRNSLHLWKNIPLGIANIARVLQSGGFAFIGRGFGPDLSDDIREKVKERRKAFHRQYYPEEKDEPQSPAADKVVSLMMESGFRTATIIPDRKSWWILAGK